MASTALANVGFKSLNLTDIEEKFVLVVAESYPQQTVRVLTDYVALKEIMLFSRSDQ